MKEKFANLHEHQKGIFAVIAAALLWSTGGLFIKLVTYNPLQISFFRCFFGSLVFIAVFRKKAVTANKFTFLNSLFYAGTLFFFVLANKTTTAANAIFLQYTAPIYVLILEPIINKTPFRRINVITVIVSFIGMTLFFLGELSPGRIEGNIYALLSGMTFAAFLLGMRKNKKEYQFSSIFYGNVILAVICLPSIFEIQHYTFSNLWMLAYLGIFQIGLAYAIFTFGLKRVYAIEASLISMVEPVLNPIWVFLGYGEVPSLLAIIGGIIVISVISLRAIILETPIMKAKLNPERE
jgi:drug/metabolite transporter (DMT)-like permease